MTCPVCAEAIAEGTTKCPHCGESLDGGGRRQAAFVLPPGTWGSPQKPHSVQVLALLLGAFAAIGLLGTAALLFGPDLMSKIPQHPKMMELQQASAYKTYMTVAYSLGLAANALSLWAATGLLRMKAWARALTLGLQYYTLVALIGGTAVTYALLLRPLLGDASVPPPIVYGAVGGAVGTMCMGWILPAIVIYFMRRKNVVDAFEYWKGRA